MCQQWFTLLGLLTDIVGFLFIAKEWLWAINLQGAEQVHEWMGDQVQPHERDAKFAGWRDQFRTRSRLFKIGLGLVVIGFIFQAIGSFPASMASRLNIVSCS